MACTKVPGPAELSRSPDPSKADFRRGRCGEQFVRTQYPKEVEEHRRRVKKERATVLVAVTDADVLSVPDRLARVTSGAEAPLPQELITILIPKRNIETWFRCLLRSEADEETDYKGNEYDIRGAATELWRHARSGAPLAAGVVPSLARAIGELRRIENLLAAR